jgi:hypothetical protein
VLDAAGVRVISVPGRMHPVRMLQCSERLERIDKGGTIVGFNRAGVRYRARLKRRRREAARLAAKAKETPNKGPGPKGGNG